MTLRIIEKHHLKFSSAMSTNKSVSLLKAIKPYKQGWRIQVKLVHSWRQKTNYGGDTLELIFADESGDKIHCTCKSTYIQHTQRDLRLGEWHMIDIFSLSNATGQYRTTNHTYKMSIIEDTKISKSSLVCDDKFLSFAGFEEIGNGTLKTHFLIDVIGQVTSLRDIQTVQVSGKDKKKVEFRLLDSRLIISVVKALPVVCGENMLNSLTIISNKQKIICVLDLVCENWVLQRPNNELALALIDPKKDKHTDWSWFYQGHDSCKKRAILIKSKSENLASNEKPVFWCTSCRTNVTSVSPKFKLHLVVKDDTSTCKLMILDTIGRVIVGCEAEEL
uniref:Replication protein A 70 kDa DNA-binding subunit B/D first OB fold domain-containing protein n=1 Tax=Brassica oleracea var. oleracea TaxID=109376 RepID=A0A0D3CQY7_BRAOL